MIVGRRYYAFGARSRAVARLTAIGLARLSSVLLEAGPAETERAGCLEGWRETDGVEFRPLPYICEGKYVPPQVSRRIYRDCVSAPEIMKANDCSRAWA
jgi:hypothetical protein